MATRLRIRITELSYRVCNVFSEVRMKLPSSKFPNDLRKNLLDVRQYLTVRTVPIIEMEPLIKTLEKQVCHGNAGAEEYDKTAQ